MRTSKAGAATLVFGTVFLVAAPRAVAQGTWSPTSTIGAPSARYSALAVWTGSRMIVWGGGYNTTGGVYDPAGNSWTATSLVGRPAARDAATAVWTGSRMIVWGGWDVNRTTLDSGCSYDPASNTWSATSTAGAPAARAWHTAVWTGTKMIVWGGATAGGYTNTGGIYDPATDTWKPTSTVGAPGPRHVHTAVWTGSRMIVFGGWNNGFGWANTGGQYDPETDTWTPTSTAGVAPRNYHTAVWTGSRMVVWGGMTSALTNTGDMYDPASNTWTATATAGAPSPRAEHTAVVVDGRMIVWGGNAPYPNTTNTGGILDPSTNSWISTSTSGAPAARADHSAVSTGTRMIVWGGGSSTGGILDTLQADLSITKTDGVGLALPGTSTTYTIVATNAGPASVVGGTVVDNLPAALVGASWTCVGAGGATCTASGSGSIHDTVGLPAGASVTYALTATISSSATGWLTNVATIQQPLGVADPDLTNNSAVDTDQLLLPVNLVVTKTDGQATASPGQAVSYTIAVTNSGPNTPPYVTVTDVVPAEILSPAWTCAAAGGAACASPGGTGSIAQDVQLPAGGSVTFTLTGTVSAAPASLTNTATAVVSGSYGDPDTTDNTATDTDLLVCGTQPAVVANGSPSALALEAGGTRWLVFETTPGRTYSIELTGRESGVPAATLFTGDDGCSGTSTATVRDTTLIDPAAGSGRRLSFKAQGAASAHRLRLVNETASELAFTATVSETTLFSASWTTSGSYETYYSLQNTTGSALSATLTLTKADGTSAGTTTLSVPAGATAATNTASLGTPRGAAGTARLTHDGPPGSLIAEAAIANFGYTPAYVQPVRFKAVREPR